MGLLPDTQNCVLRMRRECRERSPRHRLQRKPLVNDPDMHHGTCVTHVSWCMSGSLTSGGGEKRSRHSRRMRNTQFYVSGKRPIRWPLRCWQRKPSWNTRSRRHYRDQRLWMEIGFTHANVEHNIGMLDNFAKYFNAHTANICRPAQFGYIVFINSILVVHGKHISETVCSGIGINARWKTYKW